MLRPGDPSLEDGAHEPPVDAAPGDVDAVGSPCAENDEASVASLVGARAATASSATGTRAESTPSGPSVR